jgi:hypothetical protein
MHLQPTKRHVIKKSPKVMKDSAFSCSMNTKNFLQRVEEKFPAVRASMVSVLCLCSQTEILMSSVNSHSIRNQRIFYAKLVLVFIIHVGSLHGSSYDNSLVYYVGEVSIQGE